MGAAGVAAGAALSDGVVTPLNSELTTSAIRAMEMEIFQIDLDIAATYFLQTELRISCMTLRRSLKFPYIVAQLHVLFYLFKKRGAGRESDTYTRSRRSFRLHRGLFF